jgi:hypothetical protein
VVCTTFQDPETGKFVKNISELKQKLSQKQPNVETAAERALRIANGQ